MKEVDDNVMLMVDLGNYVEGKVIITFGIV